jgi:tetratricopeptide (TPR) repeat protein
MLKARHTYLSFTQVYNILRDDPEHKEALVVGGQIAQQMGEPLLARSLFARALKASPRDADVLSRYLEHLNSMGSFAEVTMLIGRVKGSVTPSAQLHFLEAYALEKLQEIEPAISQYRNALSLNPKHRKSLFYYGQLLLNLGDRAEALLRLRYLCQIFPKREEHWLLYGHALRITGSKKQALKCYHKALKRRSDYCPAHFAIAENLSADHPSRAERAYRRSLNGVEPVPIAYRKLADIAFKRGDTQSGYRALLTYSQLHASTEEKRELKKTLDRLEPQTAHFDRL